MLPELWSKVITQLDCNTILNIKLTCQYFNKLCNEQNFYLKRKFQGFPRPGGFCLCYDVSEWYNNFLDWRDDNEIDKFPEEELIYYQDTIKIIRGDLIYFTGFGRQNRDNHYRDVRIFDGQKLLKFDANGTIPKKFTIINNDVPIKYWSRNIPNEMVSWFDHWEVRQQLIDNIDIHVSGSIIKTCFNYNGQNYLIKYISGYGTTTDEQLISEIKTIFNTNLPLILMNIRYLDLYIERRRYVKDGVFNPILNK